MSRYRLMLNSAFTQDGQDHSGSSAYWNGVDGDGLNALLALAGEAEQAIKNVENKGGSISCTLAMKIMPLDGGPLPPGAPFRPQTYAGITRLGKSDLDDEMVEIGKRLAAIGRANAEAKEGK